MGFWPNISVNILNRTLVIFCYSITGSATTFYYELIKLVNIVSIIVHYELADRNPYRPTAFSEFVPRIYGHKPERSPGHFPLQPLLRHCFALHACLLQRLLQIALQ